MTGGARKWCRSPWSWPRSAWPSPPWWPPRSSALDGVTSVPSARKAEIARPIASFEAKLDFDLALVSVMTTSFVDMCRVSDHKQEQ